MKLADAIAVARDRLSLSRLRLEADRQLATYGITMMVLPVAIFALQEIRLFPALSGYALTRLTLRLVLIGLGIWAVRAIGRASDRDDFSRRASAWTIVSLALIFVIIVTQPAGATMRIRLPLLCLIAVYGSLPSRDLRQLLPPIAFVVSLVLIRLFWHNGGGGADVQSDVIILVLAAVLGTLIVRRRQLYERDVEASLDAEHDAQLSRAESEERTRLIIETALDAVITIDAAGRVQGWNRQSEVIFGWSALEATGTLLVDLVVPPSEAAGDRQSVWRELLNVPALDRRLESTALRKDGSVIDVELSVTSVPIGGERLLTAFVRDITERRIAEAERVVMQEQLTQAAKMESVGRLAGGVAHDFNNMLGVILGTSEIAMANLDSKDQVYTDLAEIRKAAMRSADITRELLTFARKQSVSPKVIDLNETLGGVVTMLRRLIGEQIDLSWTPRPSLWNVRIDPTQVDQVLANLVVNARDAIAGVGRIQLETSNVVVDEFFSSTSADWRPGMYVMISVGDNGAGMDKETQAHIFEPFYTTKALGAGTGLGLPMVYGIVHQNNGFISVYSEPGAGTTIRVFLPRHLGAADVASAESPLPAVDGRETVLLVEDEPQLLRLSTTILERSGYQVLSAGSPEEALRTAQEYDGTIHLLLTDVVMPNMNGRDLADRLVATRPGLRTLFMSGFAASVLAPDGVLDESVNFIQKPFSVRELRSRLRSVIDASEGEVPAT